MPQGILWNESSEHSQEAVALWDTPHLSNSINFIIYSAGSLEKEKKRSHIGEKN